MRKHVQPMVMVTFVLILVTGLVGCNRDDSNNPIVPGIPKQETPVQGGSEPLVNFQANRADSGELGAYVGHGFFMVRIPPDDYVLKYQTGLGIFYLVFRATENAIITVGLQPGDEVLNAWIATGTVNDIGKEKQERGIVTLYCWPGGPVEWWEVFSVP